MTDTARALLTAALLSASAAAAYAWRVSRTDASEPERLIGELRLARWMAILLAATGSVPIGLAVDSASIATAHFDVTLGVAFVVFSGFILEREPREALLFGAGGFLVHSLFTIAHRPGWLSPDLTPHWYASGCATYDVVMAAICFWGRRIR